MEIQLKYRGGGSLIKRAPLFSSDGLCLYVPCKNYLRSYSVTTGEHIKNYEGFENVIVGASVHPLDPDLLLVCSIKGEIAVWKLKAEMLMSKDVVKVWKNAKVCTFHLFKTREHDNDRCNILLSMLQDKLFYLCMYDLKTLSYKSTLLKIEREPIFVDIGGPIDSQFVAVVDQRTLFCRRLNGSLKKVMKIMIPGQSTATCAACHPTLDCVAVGDSSGRVRVWHNLFHNPMKSYAMYHWHTLPVNVVMFSCMGTEMYTGGNECVMVRWQLNNVHTKQFLPRLPAPIVHLVSAPGNLHLAVATQNNALHVIDARLAVRQLVQEMTWGAPFPAGLHADPRTKSVVLNGHIGNVQFYSPRTMSLLYNLDIVGQNKLTDERELKIPNTTISKIALSKTSEWLACIEDRMGDSKFAEIRLKFFHFNERDQIYELNTSIEFPHENGVNSLQFQNVTNQSEMLCVTSGGDKSFKVWNLADIEKIEHKTKSWRCNASASYKNLDAGPVSFSADGSLVAVAFDSCLTVWKPETCEFKCSLLHPSYKSKLNVIQFGNVDCCHLIVSCSNDRLNVWNLLTLALMRTVEVSVSLLCADPLSARMAVFTTDNSLYVFTPQTTSFEYERKKLCPDGETVLAACFVPHDCEMNNSISWQRMSQLYFVNSSQELLCLESRSDSPEKEDLEYSKSHVQRSAFEALLAETITDTSKRMGDHILANTGLSNGILIKELIQPPVHTMAPMRLLCGSVLRSLITTEGDPKHQNAAAFFNEHDDMTDENKLESKSDSEEESNKSVAPSRSNKIKAVKISKENSKTECETLKNILNESLTWTSVLVD